MSQAKLLDKNTFESLLNQDKLVSNSQVQPFSTFVNQPIQQNYFNQSIVGQPGGAGGANNLRDQKWIEKKLQREQQQKQSFMNTAQHSLKNSQSMPTLEQFPQNIQPMTISSFNQTLNTAASPPSFNQTMQFQQPPQMLQQPPIQLHQPPGYQESGIQFVNQEQKKNILTGASGLEDFRNQLKEQYRREMQSQHQEKERSKSSKREEYLQKVQSSHGQNNISRAGQIPPSSHSSNQRFKYSYFNINNTNPANNNIMPVQNNYNNMPENKIEFHDVQGQQQQQQQQMQNKQQQYQMNNQQQQEQDIGARPIQSSYQSRPQTQTSVGDNLKKTQYLNDLKNQIEIQKDKKKSEKEILKQKDQYEDTFLSGFGKGGAGAPLKDQHGNAITIRNPDHHKNYERQKPIKGILKKQDNFDYIVGDSRRDDNRGFANFPPVSTFETKNEIMPQYNPPPPQSAQMQQPDPLLAGLPVQQTIQLPNNPSEMNADYYVKIDDPIKGMQQIPPTTTQMPNMNPDQFHQFANQLTLYLHQERMARESEKRQKNEEYDRELERIRNDRMELQKKYEKERDQRESEYKTLHEENMKRINELWEKKMHDERKRWSMMRQMKLAKGQEGEESILLTESFPNILEQELKVELQNLTHEINQNTQLAQEKMNELQEASNAIEEEKLEAERQIQDLNDQLYKMKYDDVIRHKYVYQNLLSNAEDASTKPKNYIPQLLPRRKNLDYIADIPNAQDVNIPLSNYPEDTRKYYDTKTDPLYTMKPLGHDIYTTDIMKQKKELGTLDSDWKQMRENVEQKQFDFHLAHLNPGLYGSNKGFVDSMKIPERYGGFTKTESQYFTTDSKPLASKSKFTYL